MSKATSENNKETLNNRILHGLSMEWDFAARQLHLSHGFKLRKPLFSLKPQKQKLASWDSSKREICFSHAFVYHHSWGDIKDVLLHEMAHQLTSEFFNATNETAHGKHFQKACQLLRANPKASGNYPPLSERILDPVADENDKIMFRIQKLLALAESNHIHEAEAALSKAHQLIEKYNIDMINMAEKREYVSIYLGKPALRHFREEYSLANFITENYFVYGIWVSAYVIEKEKLGRVLEISGTSQNIRIASYVYDFVSTHIDMAWREYNKDNNLNRYRKTDFATGIIEGLQSKINADNSGNSEEKHLPVKVEDAQLTDYASYKYPIIKHFKRGSSTVDPTIRKDGENIGKKMIISRGIEQKDSEVQRYIGITM